MMRVICQFRIFTIIVLSFFVLSVKGQVYQEMPQYGYRANRMAFDSTLSIPTVCGVPTLKSNITKKAAIAFDSCNGVFYQYNPKTLVWSQITGGGGGVGNYVDTIYRELGKDSIIYTISGRRRAIKDSIGGVTNRLVTTVYNNSGSTITKGSVIYINGRHSSNLPTIALAQANTEQNSYSTFAMVQDDILNNNSGTVIQAGNISNLNLPTATYTDGQLVYLSPSVAGGITTTKPLAPNHIVKIGTITRAHPTFGSIELKIENGWQLDELSDVKIATVPADSTILQFSRVDSLWHDVSVKSVGGYFNKNIIMNGTSSNRLGNYVNGDTIPVAGLSLDSAFKIIAQRAVPPTYIQPTTTISSSPSNGSYEIGSALSLTFSSTFTQNDAGSLISTTYYKNNTSALAGNTDAIASLTSPTQYKVTKTYNQGACKTNNLGQIDCTGRINAGSISSSNITFTPFPKRYWGYSSSGTPNSSDVITASGGGSEFTTSKDKYVFSIVVTGINQYIYYAYPSYFGPLTSIVISGLESIGAFNQTTVSVTNAQGYTQNYYVYTSQNQFNNTTITFTSVN